MKFIRLTRILDTLTEEAEEKYVEFQNMVKREYESIDEEPTDEDGKTAAYYELLGIPIPKELKRQGGSKEFKLEFREEDYNRTYSKFLCNLARVEGFDALEDGTTLVCYPNDFEIIVKESIEEIENLINNL